MLFKSPYKDGEYPKTVGFYRSSDDEDIINRDFISDGLCEGFVYKNWINFYESLTDVCYVSEYEDNTYTAEDFYNIAAGNKELAIDLFENCYWQSPETLLDEYIESGDIIEVNNTYKYKE